MFKIMAFDLECLPPEVGVPNPENDPIIIISFTINDGTKKLLIAKPGIDTETREFFNTEEEILKRFIQLIKKYDPDIICSYNGFAFDHPYLDTRLLKYNLAANIGRDNRTWEIRNFGGKNEVIVTGRCMIDVMHLIQRNFQLINYSLNTSAKELIGEEKRDVPASKMREIWINGTNDELNNFYEYAEVDADLTLKLLIDTSLLSKYIALSQVSGALLHSVINGGQGQLIEPLLMKEFYKDNRLFPNRPSENEMNERKKLGGYEGAFVGDPVIGLHKNIAVVDYVSLYPTSMISHNICVTSLSEDGTIETPIGAKFISKDIYVGVFPRVLEKLFNERIRIKNLMKQINDKNEYDYMDSMQYAIKIYLNSMYGLTGFVGSRFFIQDVAASITAIGRKTILRANDLTIKHGYEVLYNDTDSIFIKMPELKPKNDIGNILSALLNEVNSELPSPMKLTFEDFFISGIFFARKRYILLDENGKYKIRGIEMRRRDWAPIVPKTMKVVFDKILKEDDLDGALKYAQSVIIDVGNYGNDGIDLSNGNMDITDLTITKKYGRIDYKNKQPHAELVNRLTKENRNVYGLGDRVGYIIRRGNSKELLYHKSVLPEDILNGRYQIDSKYYLERQLFPPLERIFDVFNMSALLKNRGQTTFDRW